MSEPTRIASVFAHPDDDTYALSGTYAMSPDLEVTVVMATSGEAGPISERSGVSRDGLGAAREAEARDAIAEVGHADANLRFLRLPDGGLASMEREPLVDSIAGILAEVGPDLVVTFGPEGITRHPDHIAVGEATTEAFRIAGQGLGSTGDSRRPLRGLYYTCIPESVLQGFWRLLRMGGAEVDPDAPFMPRGVPDDTIAVEVDISSVFERKMRALLAHRTQADELEEIPAEFRKSVFGREWFVRAWPSGPPESRARSLFEDADRAR